MSDVAEEDTIKNNNIIYYVCMIARIGWFGETIHGAGEWSGGASAAWFANEPEASEPREPGPIRVSRSGAEVA